MTWMHHRIVLALVCSLFLHVLPFLADIPAPSVAPKKPAPLLAAYLQPPPPAQAQPPLILPEPPKPAKAEPPPQPPKPEQRTPSERPARENWTAAVKKQLKDLDRQGKFYPEEAIARGLEGEAVVLLMLDEAGNPIAARIEQSSGHQILDDAALRAVRSLKSLPAEAPRDVQLPVRFRLR